MLREGTRDAHQGLDQHPALARLMQADSLAAYGDCLRVFARGWLPLEAAAESIAASESGLAPFFLPRSHALIADLTELGTPIPDCDRMPPSETFVTWPDQLACFYVLNGAQLGSVMIERQVLCRLPGAPVRFFKTRFSYGPRAWAGFRRFLDHQELTETERTQAVAVANRIFRAFSANLEFQPSEIDGGAG